MHSLTAASVHREYDMWFHLAFVLYLRFKQSRNHFYLKFQVYNFESVSLCCYADIIRMLNHVVCDGRGMLHGWEMEEGHASFF